MNWKFGNCNLKGFTQLKDYGLGGGNQENTKTSFGNPVVVTEPRVSDVSKKTRAGKPSIPG